MNQILHLHSDANGRSFPTLVYLPDSATAAGVAVFLHGRQKHDDYHPDTLRRLYPWDAELQRAADAFQAAIVIPLLGSKAHLDSPIDPAVRRATLLGEELPLLVRDQLRILHDRRAWSIHGFSMGGTGALNVLARYPDVYSVCTNFGGNCDPAFFAKTMGRPCPAEDVLGPYPACATHYDTWSNRTAIDRLRGRSDVAIAFGCGRDDPRLRMIQQTRDLAIEAGLAVTYLDYPGGHVYDATQMLMQLAAASALAPLIGGGRG